MKLKWIKLEGFRNYYDLELELKSPITALVGLNAQGKTNLLESIAFLALGKSFRASRSLETLHWDRSHGRIKGCIEEEGKEVELEVYMQREPETKKVKKAEKWTLPKHFLGSLRIVLFTPDDLDLVSGSPALRRQFLDRLLLQLNGGYVETFSQYQRILDQRNALLKRIREGRAQNWELDLWDARLCEEATRLWERRHAFMDFLKTPLPKDYQRIAGGKKTLSFFYQNHRERFDEKLAAAREHDLRTGATSVGPHRDDFILYLEGRSLQETGSRGECRSAVLALKMAELRYMELRSGEKPLLLLDDVFSELDAKRQEKLGHLLQDYQTILTTTALEHVEKLKNKTVYTVMDGKLLLSTDLCYN
ncbi:DNA replication/repair protein RecF [Candidatus Peregrinibacteria bacterium]|nr:MAG: DNA replication/repair protein RecF [Candidatus Peregrinibacteria bacterium]